LAWAKDRTIRLVWALDAQRGHRPSGQPKNTDIITEGAPKKKAPSAEHSISFIAYNTTGFF